MPTQPYSSTEDDQAYPLVEGCPGLLYALGTSSTKLFSDPSFTQIDPEVHGYVCHGYLEEVQTKDTFNVSDLSISTRSPPVPFEDNTATNLNFIYGDYYIMGLYIGIPFKKLTSGNQFNTRLIS